MADQTNTIKEGMEERLNTLAKTLRDVAIEAEGCCEYVKQTDELKQRLEFKEKSILDKERKIALNEEAMAMKKRILEVKEKQIAAKGRRMEVKEKETVNKEKEIATKAREMADREKDNNLAIATERNRYTVLEKRLEESIGKQNLLQATIERLKSNPTATAAQDQLCPPKVAEIYEDLYDNQWTNAFEVLQEEYHEKATIDKLLQIFQHTFEFCKEQSKQQNKSIQTALLLVPFNQRLGFQPENNKLSSLMQSYLNQCRKEIYCETVESMYEIYVTNIQQSYDEELGDILKVRPFVKECIKTSWLCLIQTPPLHVVFEVDMHGKLFDSGVYRTYTKSGTHIDYIVWPALLLRENGPVLAKAIAQGKQMSMKPIVAPKPVRLKSNSASVLEHSIHIQSQGLERENDFHSVSTDSPKSSRSDIESPSYDPHYSPKLKDKRKSSQRGRKSNPKSRAAGVLRGPLFFIRKRRPMSGSCERGSYESDSDSGEIDHIGSSRSKPKRVERKFFDSESNSLDRLYRSSSSKSLGNLVRL